MRITQMRLCHPHCFGDLISIFFIYVSILWSFYCIRVLYNPSNSPLILAVSYCIPSLILLFPFFPLKITFIKLTLWQFLIISYNIYICIMYSAYFQSWLLLSLLPIIPTYSSPPVPFPRSCSFSDPLNFTKSVCMTIDLVLLIVAQWPHPWV